VADTEPAAARRWLSRALEISADDTVRDEIRLDLATVLNRSGDFKAAEETAADALRVTAGGGRRAVALRVALRRTLANALDHQDRCLEAAAVSQSEANATDVDQTERARFAAEALERRTHVGDSHADAEARALLPDYEALGDPAALRSLLTALHQAAAWRGDFSAALDFAERMVGTTRDASLDTVENRLLAAALARVGDIDRAKTLLLEEVRTAESQRDPRQLSFVLTELALLDVQAGRWDEAVSNAEAAASLADELRLDTRYNEAVSLLATLATRRGDADRAAALIATLRGARPWVAGPARARALEASGEHERARDTITALWDEAKQTTRRRDLLGYATDLVRLCVGAGDEQTADEVIAALQEMERMAGAPVRAVAALCAGIRNGDAAMLQAAAQIAGDGGLLDLQASAREAAGAELVRRGEREAAVALLREAADYYRGVSAELDVRRSEAALRLLGVRIGPTGRRARQKSGWQSLSGTEVRVAKLASVGLTNAEIGARLFISGRTVERHLTHIYNKLGIGSRIELARLVART
jgi:DNA-binding CsgD family transcriptional regulator/tetratricopeptide (TPR) repeat protein